MMKGNLCNRILIAWGILVSGCLCVGMTVSAAKLGYLKSWGTFKCMDESGNEVCIDSGDFDRLRESMDALPDYLSMASDEAYQYGFGDIHGPGDYMASECEHHVHYGNTEVQPDGKVLYQHEDPDGCFVAAGHTHDVTGSCPSCTHWYTPMVTCGGSMRRISYHDYGTFKATQYQCNRCGHIQRLEWSFGESEPAGPSSCGNSVPGEPQQSHDRDCAHENNTWVIGCGCTQATRESMTLAFSGENVPVPDIRSHGVYQAGEGISLNSRDLHQMQSDFYEILSSYNGKILDQFLAGVNARPNPGKPNYTESYVWHTHDDSCYVEGRILCGSNEDTVESVYLEFY